MAIVESDYDGDYNQTEIPFSELIVVPPFLRFDLVVFLYPIKTPIPIAEKCESFLGSLPSIKSTLNNSNIINFVCAIDKENPNEFTDHSALLEHIRQVVSICDSSRGYSFILQYYTGMDIAIGSILEIPTISRSSTVYISFDDKSTVTQLPVETISTWLNRERNVMDQNQRERTLLLAGSLQDAQTQEMCDFLKQVSFYIFECSKNPQIIFYNVFNTKN